MSKDAWQSRRNGVIAVPLTDGDVDGTAGIVLPVVGRVEALVTDK